MQHSQFTPEHVSAVLSDFEFRSLSTLLQKKINSNNNRRKSPMEKGKQTNENKKQKKLFFK